MISSFFCQRTPKYNKKKKTIQIFQMLQYAAKVVAFTFIVLFAVTFFGRSFLQFLDVSVAGQSLLQSSDESSSIKFDPFTGKNIPLGPIHLKESLDQALQQTFPGLSRGGISGSSGHRFKDAECRKYRGSPLVPGTINRYRYHLPV